MDMAAFKETLFKIGTHERSRWVHISAAGRKTVKCCRREAEAATVWLFVAWLDYICRMS